MCFSPEASFSAAAFLTVIGIASWKKSLVKLQWFLAAIPLLFAVQQFAEGIVWLYLEQTLDNSFVMSTAKYIFLTFAFIIWPIWIPFSLLVVEKVQWKKYWIGGALLLGVLWSALNVAILFSYEITPIPVQNHIQYFAEGQSLPEYISIGAKLLYSFIILLPCFVSSYRYMWLFGILIAVSWMVTEIFYQYAFASVWCFFSAILSCFIFFILLKNPAKN